ncbi:MAG: hypothetical protein AAFQ38_12905 [Pseudomonadota bacterium]
MVVQTQAAYSGPYTGNGITTIFDRDYLALSEDHITVYVTQDGTKSVVASGITHTGIGSESGTVVFATPPAVDVVIEIERTVPRTQQTDYSSQGGVDPEQIERDLDLLVMMAQDTFSLVDRAVLGPSGDVDAAVAAAQAAAATATNVANSLNPYLGYAAAQAAIVPSGVNEITVSSGGLRYSYVRDAAGTALTTGDGANWKPIPPIRPEHFGSVDTPANAQAAIQAAVDYANSIFAEVVFERKEYVTDGFVLKNFVGLRGVNEVEIKRSGAGLLLKTDGFDDFADDVDRSFVWHSSNTARNAQDYAQGQYVMVASSRTDFDNATWWLANSGDTSTDAGWDPVGAVVGCVGAAITGEITFDGVTDAGAGDTLVGLYGIDIKMDGDLKFKNAGTPLHTESPGLVYSVQVGRNLQWSVNGIECSEFSQVGWRAGHQSDGSIYNTKVYAREGVSPILLGIHQKLSGTKWFGGHAWGGDDGTIGAQVGALTNSMFGFEFERPVVVQQGGFQFYGQAYRANDVSSEDGAAFVLEANVSGCLIQSRVNHFRHPLRIVSPTGIGNEFNIAHYSEDVAAAPFDPSGSTVPNPTKNEWKITVTADGFSDYSLPQLKSYRFRRRRQFIPFAAAITPSHASGDFIEVGQLTGNITINTPTGAEEGDEIQFMFQQDATAGRTIAWSSDFVGGPTAAGAANQRRAVRFVYDGVRWIVCGAGNWN